MAKKTVKKTTRRKKHLARMRVLVNCPACDSSMAYRHEGKCIVRCVYKDCELYLKEFEPPMIELVESKDK